MKRRIILAAAAAAAVMLTACAAGGTGNETVSAGMEPSTEESFTEIETEETTAEETTTTTTPSTTTTTTETTTEFTHKEIPFEDTAQNAYERLIESFNTAEGVVYPDDYAGVYSYGNTLFVSITEYTPPDSYKELLGEYTCVRYETVTRSFNRLSEICVEAAGLLDERFGVEDYYVDVPSNMAAVVIRNEDTKTAKNFLKITPGKSFDLEEIVIIMAEPEE